MLNTVYIDTVRKRYILVSGLNQPFVFYSKTSRLNMAEQFFSEIATKIIMGGAFAGVLSLINSIIDYLDKNHQSQKK